MDTIWQDSCTYIYEIFVNRSCYKGGGYGYRESLCRKDVG